MNDVWADFALLDEAERIAVRGKDSKDEARLREAYTIFVQRSINGETPPMTPELRSEVEKILTAVTTNFEIRRARIFKEVHPLALQVILSTGVLNGILVSRTVESCALLLRGILENRLELDLHVDERNYRLVERTTQSTVRVIARNNLLSNALEAIYSPSQRSS